MKDRVIAARKKRFMTLESGKKDLQHVINVYSIDWIHSQSVLIQVQLFICLDDALFVVFQWLVDYKHLLISLQLRKEQSMTISIQNQSKCYLSYSQNLRYIDNLIISRLFEQFNFFFENCFLYPSYVKSNILEHVQTFNEVNM